MKVLLVDPPYRAEFPPLGLLKLGRFHRDRGDEVAFVKGPSVENARRTWDRVYIGSLFTYQWTTLIKTIRFYSPAVKDGRRDLFVGGPLATLLQKDLAAAAPCRPVGGIIDRAEKIGLEGGDIDGLLPDYSLLPDPAVYPVLREAWPAAATRGCSGNCAFCSVRFVDPRCVTYVPLKDQIDDCRRVLGEKDGLALLDNNVALSPALGTIVDEIAAEGFTRGRRDKWVDFTQGFEPALFGGREGEARADHLARLPLRPVRIAWDFPGEKTIYERGVKAFSTRGFKEFSTPLLFGFRDRPEDLYTRLRRIIELEGALGVEIKAEPLGYIAPHLKRRPSLNERARGWGLKEGDLDGFKGLIGALEGRNHGDLEGFIGAFGENEGEFREKLRRRD